MGKYVLRRLELLVPTVFGISVLVFALMFFRVGFRWSLRRLTRTTFGVPG